MMKRIIKAPSLKTGDMVALVAPAGIVERDIIEDAVKVLESWGLSVSPGKHLYERHGIFAGTDAQRLADLQVALDDPRLRAVICARGGYGVSRLIDGIDFRSFRRKPKWIVGYSDITVLHLFINSRLGISTLHAEMPLNYHKCDAGSATMTTLRHALFEGPESQEWETGTWRQGEAEGIITGGNLSLISNLMGTEIKSYLRGKILFIEEKGEAFYSLDRMITGLSLAGVLKDLRGLIIGGLTDIRESDHRYAVNKEDIIMESVGKYDFPVAFDFPAGHTEDNRAVALGSLIHMEVAGSKASLHYR
ncbi:MAG: LD-carboxypeptidase [Bacteroidales bacterium]|nr:LD-carboxypeptidase [Bacteroidales bacterium]